MRKIRSSALSLTEQSFKPLATTAEGKLVGGFTEITPRGDFNFLCFNRNCSCANTTTTTPAPITTTTTTPLPSVSLNLACY